jgi:O-antigen/teichoic acid export membrane protein
VSAANEPSLSRKVVIGSSWAAMSNLARQLLSLGCVAILARLLGPSAYGLMGLAALILAFLAGFRDLGTATAIVQRPQVSGRLLSSLFWLNGGLGLLLSVAGYLAADPTADFFKEPKLALILRVVSFSFFVSAIGAVPNSVLARNMAFNKIAIVDFTASLAGYAVAIACAWRGLGVWSLVAANMVTAAWTTTLSFIYCRWLPTVEFDLSEVRSVARFSLNLTGFGVVNYFARNADNVVVGRYLGSQSLGYYQMAYNLFLLPLQNVTSVLAQVLNPAFSKIQTENERFKTAYVRACLFIALVTFPLTIGLAVVADPFVRAVLGSKWIPVIPLLQVLAPVGLFQSIQGTTGQIFVAKGRTDWMFRWGLYSSAVFVTAFLIGVRWGTLGVAAAYSLSYLVFVLYPGFRVAFTLVGLNVGDFFRHFVPQLSVTAAMAAGCLGWMALLRLTGVANPLTILLTTVVVGALLYVGGMLLLRPPVIGDLEDVAESHGNPLRRILRRHR